LRNDGADNFGNPIFTDINAPRIGARLGSISWGDYDNDHYPDSLLTGTIESQPLRTSKLYHHNQGSSFTELALGLPGVQFGGGEWGDCDNDGDLDILVKGLSNNNGVGPISKVYRNDGNVFNAAATLEYRYEDGAAWGDYDSDGDLDVVTNGRTLNLTPPLYPLIYRNEQQAFGRNTVAAEILRDNDQWNGAGFGDVAWADYDNDHDLDLLVSGLFEFAFNRISSATFIYENGHAPGQANTPPTAPTSVRAIASAATIMTLTWNTATDQQTPAAGLTYNLRVGTTPGGAEIISPHSRPDGYRQLAQMGNTNHATQRPLLRLTPGRTYYWSVQAVDHNFAGSPFAPEQQFVAGISTSVHEPASELPKVYSLSQNYPNPFDPVTSVQYAVAVGASGRSPVQVSLKIYDVLGNEVATLVDKKQPAGYYRVTFDGRGLASGVYLIHIRAGNFVATRKMLISK
jgi:hypothetical protein